MQIVIFYLIKLLNLFINSTSFFGMVYRVFWKKEWQLTSLFFLENSVDRGYSSWGLKESDPTDGPTLGLSMYNVF